MNKISTREMLSEVQREIAMRQRVYPRWVESGKLKQQAADRQIAVMEAIAARIEKALAREEVI